MLYGLPFTTYQAYNNYGGKSTLRLQLERRATPWRAPPRAVKVSFDRPYEQVCDPASRDWYTQHRLPRGVLARAQGLRRRLHRPTPTSSARRRSPDQHAVYFAGAHDEYCSAAMRDGARARRATPASSLFFSGANERLLEDPLRERADRCARSHHGRSTRPRRAAAGGPERHPRRAPGATRPAPNKPENALIGAMYIGDNDTHVLPADGPRRRGQRPHLALHRPGHPGPGRARPSSAPCSSAGSGTRASRTARSRPACSRGAPRPVTGALIQNNGAVHDAGHRDRRLDQVHGGERGTGREHGHQPLGTRPRPGHGRGGRARPPASSRRRRTSCSTWARRRRRRTPASRCRPRGRRPSSRPSRPTPARPPVARSRSRPRSPGRWTRRRSRRRRSP